MPYPQLPRMHQPKATVSHTHKQLRSVQLNGDTSTDRIYQPILIRRLVNPHLYLGIVQTTTHQLHPLELISVTKQQRHYPPLAPLFDQFLVYLPLTVLPVPEKDRNYPRTRLKRRRSYTTKLLCRLYIEYQLV